MEKADEYRMDAAAALKLAGSAANQQEKALMLKVAQEWLDLAHLAEASKERPINARRLRRNDHGEVRQQSHSRT
jgi:hypothetical protein